GGIRTAGGQDHAHVCGPGGRAADYGEVGVPEPTGGRGAGAQGQTLAQATVKAEPQDAGYARAAAVLGESRSRAEKRPGMDGPSVREVGRRQAILPDPEPERANIVGGRMLAVGVCERKRGGLLPHTIR